MVWTHAIAAALPAFLASLVEFVEALTIVLAVGVTRGWQAALWGSVAGAIVLAVLVLAFGPALAGVPIAVLQLVIGALLLLFGLRWLRKAILRSGGALALHDEATIFAKQSTHLGGAGAAVARIDALGFLTSLKAVVLEGLEVVFIVIAVGAAGGALVPATLGAALAGIIVVAAGFAVRRPLARIPENALKFAVGVLLSAFGTFWTGEALGVGWPGDDLALLALVAAFAASAALGVAGVRSVQRRKQLA